MEQFFYFVASMSTRDNYTFLLLVSQYGKYFQARVYLSTMEINSLLFCHQPPKLKL